MATIKSLKQNNNSQYHPAVGYSYNIVLSNGIEGQTDDDTLMAMFDLDEVNPSELIGQEWDENYSL